MSTTETPTAATVKELRRSRDDRWLAGVAGGLGRYFEISPTFFRIGFAILALIGGAGILLYVASALVIPADGERESIASEALKRHRERPWLLVGVALVGIAILSIVAQADFWPNSGFAWFLLLVGALAIALAQRRSGESAPSPTADGEVVAAPPARRQSLFLPVVGALLALGGVLALLSMLGVDVRWDLALAVAAVGIGAVVVAGALLQRRTGGLALIGLLLATLAIAVSAIDVRLDGPIGSRTFHPVAPADLTRSYELAIGELELDLRNTLLDEGETSVDANVGVGELRILVPSDMRVALVVEATASAGEVTVLGQRDEGVDAHIGRSQSRPLADRVLRIDAHVGLGSVIVSRT
jgi:phage shock protein PspC (stress-responsive transcriptional regulator)